MPTHCEGITECADSRCVCVKVRWPLQRPGDPGHELAAMVATPLAWSLFFALFSLYFDGVTSKYVKGHLITAENWAFVARFCFLSEEGKFEYKVEYDKEYAVQNLLLYYDSSSQWPAVYHSNKTCEQKEGVLNIQLNQIINLTENRLDERCRLRPPSPKPRPFTFRSPTPAPPPHQVIECHDARRFRSARERWWFLAVSNCNGTKGLNLQYEFRMTNGRPGDYWHEHFSADEFYILPSLTFFTIAYMIMIIAVVICTVELKARHLLHATYKIFVSSVLLQEAGILVQSIAYLRYANDGVGYPRVRQLGRLLEASSETTFMLLLLLLAKGYTVTRARLRLSSSVKLTIFMCSYSVTYVALFIYEREFFDPGEVLYLYESPAGYGLMGLRILAWWMFVYSTVFTLKHYPDKANFYYPFNLVATLWFVVGPCFILSANSLIDKWVRESIVFAVLHAVAFCGHLQFLILTRPAKANKNFPFHVRTSQIGVMEVSGGVAGNSNLYRFGRHAYAPGNAAPLPAEWLTEVPVELFAVSRGVAITTRQMASPFAVTLPPRVPALPAPPTRRPSSPLTTSLSSSISLSPPSSPPPKNNNSIPSNSLPVLRPLGISGQDLAGGEARVGDSHVAGTGSGTSGPRSGPSVRPKDPNVFMAHCERVSTA